MLNSIILASSLFSSTVTTVRNCAELDQALLTDSEVIIVLKESGDKTKCKGNVKALGSQVVASTKESGSALIEDLKTIKPQDIIDTVKGTATDTKNLIENFFN